MIKKYLLENYLSVKYLAANCRGFIFELSALLGHIYCNRFILWRHLARSRKLHFGAGTDIKDGFINVDINGNADVSLDVRNRLNIVSDTVEYIYSSHFIEHLNHDELLAHLRECYRILMPGGVIRLGVPDFPRVLRDYCNGNGVLLETRRAALAAKLGMPEDLVCPMDIVNKAVYEFGAHKICLDYEKVYNLLVCAGFSPAEVRASEFDPQIDVASRRELTFFVEATK